MTLKHLIYIVLCAKKLLTIDNIGRNFAITPLPFLHTITNQGNNESSTPNLTHVNGQDTSIYNHQTNTPIINSTNLNTRNYSLYVSINFDNIEWTTTVVNISNSLILQVQQLKTIITTHNNNMMTQNAPYFSQSVSDAPDILYNYNELEDFCLASLDTVYMRISSLLFKYLTKHLNTILNRTNSSIFLLRNLLQNINTVIQNKHEVPQVLLNTNLEFIFEEGEGVHDKYKKFIENINEAVYSADRLFYPHYKNIICRHLEQILNATEAYNKHYKLNNAGLANLEIEIKKLGTNLILNSPIAYSDIENKISLYYRIDKDNNGIFWGYFVSKYINAFILDNVPFERLIKMGKVYTEKHYEYLQIRRKVSKYLL